MFNRLSSFFLPARSPQDPSITPQSSMEQSLLDNDHADYPNKQHVEEAQVQRAVVIHQLDDDGAQPFNWRQFLLFLGPGFLMSIAYVDPGNLESDLQAGSRAGYTLGWVLLWATCVGFIVQLLAAKLGVATGQHLAEHCKAAYPTPARLLLWLMVELAIIGSDIQEVIGSAIAILLLSQGAIPLYAGVLLTVLLSFSLLFVERIGVRHLEAMFAGMVALMTLSFGAMFCIADIPYNEVVSGLAIPRLPSTEVITAVGMLGAVIMPHNIFLHSALVKSRQLAVDTPAAKKKAVKYFGIESAVALFFTLVINVCVMAVFAKGFYGQHIDIGLENAGEFLSSRFGPLMGFIWAIGLLAAGQASTMTGTYTGQFVMSGFIDLRVPAWKRVLFTRAIALWPTLGVALICNDSSDMDTFNQALNVLQSVQLPFAVIPVLKLTSSVKVMGELVNSTAYTVVCWGIAALVMAANVWLGHQSIKGWLVDCHWVHRVAAWVVVAGYVLFVAYLAIGVELTHGVQWLYHRIAHGNTPYPARPSYMYAHNNNATTHSNDTTNSNDVESLLHGGVTVGGVHVCEEDGEASGSDGSSGGGGKTHHGLSNGHSQHNGFSQRKEEQHQGGGKGKEGEKKKSTWDDGEASPFAMDDDGGL